MNAKNDSRPIAVRRETGCKCDGAGKTAIGGGPQQSRLLEGADTIETFLADFGIAARFPFDDTSQLRQDKGLTQ